MRKGILGLLLCVVWIPAVLAQGVGVVDASQGAYLRLLRSDVRVSVESQVAVVKATHVFRNDFNQTADVKYAFPMPEDASATGLRWQVDGAWHEAVFTASPQDTTLPASGGYIDPELTDFLGRTPLFFGIEQPLPVEHLLTVELTYVQLLPYAFGLVDFTLPGDYRRIQEAPLDEQRFAFDLASLRTIDLIDLSSHPTAFSANDGVHAVVESRLRDAPADRDYHVRYRLSADELGLFGFSTLLPDSTVPGNGWNGFFLFVAEPDPQEGSDVIEKVFTLIVDRSGSMSGDKIVQARNAAAFIVDHLNEGDRFNIVDFNESVASFRPEHVAFTPETRAAALAYIDGLYAGGATNISGAFDTAVPPFAAAGENTANIIVFFTDGMATAGITETGAILAHVQELVTQHERPISIFTFGVGPDVDRQLLTRLAAEHGGLSELLGSDELEQRITNFYLQIRNPVLLNTRVRFSPQVIDEVVPDPLPSLYKGQQMIVAGRYSEAVPVTVTLDGEAFGQPVSYSYDLALADSAVASVQFLPRVWAKLKIEHLLVRYYSLDPNGLEAHVLKDEVVALSLAYGVISPFTSFQAGADPRDPDDPDDGASTDVEEVPEQPHAAPVALLGSYPNPFSTQTTIRFEVHAARYAPAVIKIYNALGQVVRVLTVPVSGPGRYEVVWDGTSSAGVAVPAGSYFYLLSLDDAVLAGTLVRVR